LQTDAANGETSVWKLAFWGTARDARSLDRIQQLYPFTLAGFCEKKKWDKKMPRQGAELRQYDDKEEVIYCEELKGKNRFDSYTFNKLIKDSLHFSLPDETLFPIPDDLCYVRERGGMSGLVINRPPHLMISATWKNFLIYSEKYFAIPPRQMGIAAPDGDKEQLRALAVYLGSSLVDYFVFFQVPEWGVYSDFPHVALRNVRTVPTPDFTPKQVSALSKLHRELVSEKTDFRLESYGGSPNTAKQRLIDKAVFEALNVPDDLRLLIEDFRDTRLPLDKGRSVLDKLGKCPSATELQSYGHTLKDELERFLLGEARVSVDLLASPDLIRCEVKLHSNGHRVAQTVNVGNATGHHQTRQLLRSLREQLGEEFSQWVYVDRNLRVFKDDAVQIFKAPRLMDWTRTQALNDADDVIAEILTNGKPAR
jgi:hypothetical protein